MADSIVIVGLACRYPEARDPDRLWENVMGRRQSFRPMPPERLPVDDYAGTGADDLYLKRAAVLDGWTFDRQRFRVPGETYRAVDLTHWLALDVSAAALADAGLPDGDGLDRSRVGVVFGNSLTGEFSRAAMLRTRWPYVRRAAAAALAGSPLSPAAQADLLAAIEQQYKSPFAAPSDETLAGALSNTIAGRVCNYFDFQGTGYTVDGACASSLLSVSTGAAAIVDGQLDVVLAGGVDLSLDPFELVGFSRLGALANGDMRVYDARPTGFLPGEGCGVVVLCRESYAARHGLRAYARLLGWGTSSDGNGGLTRPELAGQRLALTRAYARAGVAPTAVALVEGHGTGTEVGDTTELRTLLEVRGTAGRRAVLGSVKANIGHTKAAAGVAGLIKATLALHHEVMPPTTGCVDPHPLLGDPAASLEISVEARPWPEADRYASVSAMGFGGINVHAVLGGMAATTRRRLSRRDHRLAARHPDREVVVCTAERREDLSARLAAIRDAAKSMSRGELTDLAATLAGTERGGALARFAAAVASPDELVRAIDYALDGLAAGEQTVVDKVRRVFVAVGGPLRVGLLFPGQSAPSYMDAGALDGLLDELPAGYRDRLPIPASGPVDTATAQPAIIRASLAGLRWLDTLGVRAHQAVGHSLGEIAALVWAGALTEDDAYALAKERGAAMAEASDVPAGMAGLRTDLATAADLVGAGPVVVAADNTDAQVVVSGPRADVGRVLAEAERRGIAATWLSVPHAFHSPLMAPAAPQLRTAADRLDWRPVERPLASTVTGRWWRDEDPVDLLVRQLTTPVRFRTALDALDVDLLVEVGPGRIVAELAGARAVAMDAGSGSADGLATATAALFAAGAFDSVEPYFGQRFARRFDLSRPREFISNPCETAPPEVAALPAASIAATAPSAPPAVTAVKDAASDPVAAAIARVAAALEFDPATVPADARLLADLHLTSLRVSQLAAELAADLGRALPSTPLSLATATVAEFADAIAALPAASGVALPVTGVAPWVRVLAPHLVPRPVPRDWHISRRWEIVGDLAGHPLAEPIREAFPAGAGEPTRLLALAPGLDEVPVDDIVAALRGCHRDRRPLAVVHHGGVGGAVGRSLAIEYPEVPVLVVEVPADAAGLAHAVAEAHQAWTGYTEVRYGAGGLRTVPVLRPIEVSPRRDRAIPLDAGDICLVTGGAKGIGVECAVAVARATHARLALLGRSPDTDDDVRTALARITATGAPVTYHQVDVTDPMAVAATLAGITQRHGPIRALLHSAGRNEPGAIADLTAERVRVTLAPKAGGLEHVISALDLTALRVAVTFGSVIGRVGLAGEADYAIANDWLARRCAELAVTVPDVRWLNIEWSAWSGTGMGERLGVLDGLVRQGLSPVPVDEGVAMLLRLLATPGLPATVVVAGRLPATPTLRWDDDGPELAARFLDTRLTHTPSVELVAEASLSLGTDPYLADHRIDGLAVFPAVLGLEAMTQACVALGAKSVPATFHDVRLTRPITVPERGDRAVRIAALAREDGGIEVVARSAETGFAVDHFRAWYGGPAGDRPSAEVIDLGPLIPAQRLYGPLFFHGPRFHRVVGYYGLSAYRCTAAITADPDARWFSAFHDQRLELGDPGARDAFLHVLQGCVPDRRVLPVGVDRISVYGRPTGLLTLDARQREEDGDGYLFDVTVLDAGRSVVEEWHGLALRAVGPVEQPRWPTEVLGPYLTRTLRRWRPEVSVDLGVATAEPADRAVDGYLLVATGPGPAAAVWHLVDSDPPPLSPTDTELAAELTRLTGDAPPVVAYRIVTARQVLAERGADPDAPLVLDEAGPAPWVRLTGGGCAVYSAVVEATTGTVAASVGVG